MPITALSKKTKELLGSTSLITTPVTLVRELVDNAIDANANTIEVLISFNTIDKIEVRDNGVGIHPADYDSLGRRGHTSKLRAFDDLRILAGNTFGFRGEALASANTVGKLTITTKTLSDPVAAVLQINPKEGGVLNQQNGSAPVGTTVSVSQLYHEIPVRKEVAVKGARKTLDKIKDLLRSYAVAKPHIRLAFKVLDKNSLNWNYPSRRNATSSEAVLQIFGKDVTSCCMEKEGNFPRAGGPHQESDDGAGCSETSFVFNATMWKPDAEFLRLPNHRYFSVDGRPVIGTKGAMQKLMAVYTKYLGSALPAQPSAKSLCDAFIRLDIRCPKGSYDVNIEPSKDEVLFDDEFAIVEHFTTLCEEVYGPLGSISEPNALKTMAANPPNHNPSGESCTTGRQHIELTPKLTNGENLTTEASVHAILPSNQSAIQATLKGGTEGSLSRETHQHQSSPMRRRPSTPFPSRWTSINSSADALKHVNQTFGSLDDARLTIDGSLPVHGSISDMSSNLNERVRDPHRRENGNLPAPYTASQNFTEKPIGSPPREPFQAMVSPSPERMMSQADDTLPAQHQIHSRMRTFSMTPEPEILRHRGAPPQDLDLPPSMRYPQPDHFHLPNSALYRSPVSSPVEISHQPTTGLLRRQVQPPWTPPSSLQKDQEKWQNRYGSKRQTRSDGLKQSTISFGKSQLSRETRHTQELGDSLAQMNDQSDVSKQQPTPNTQDMGITAQQIPADRFPTLARHVDNAKVPENGHQPSTRYVQRENAFTLVHCTGVQAYEEATEDKEPIMTSLPSGDPRAYLLRRQKSIAADESLGRPRKFRRTKSIFLPFENSLVDEQTRELILLVHTAIQHLSTSLKDLVRYDKYILEGDIAGALDMDLGEARRIEEQLDAVLSKWSESFGERVVVESNLSSVLRGKGVENGP
ncbi:DNA mismatch repair protein mutL [Seiridium cupressi]